MRGFGAGNDIQAYIYPVPHMRHGTENDILTYIYSMPRGNYSAFNQKESLKGIYAGIETHGEPFIDRNGARIYEWDKGGVRFRLVVRKEAGIGTQGKPKASHSPQLLKTRVKSIITFYSDRNLNKPMEFKNPKLREEAQ